MTRTNPRKRVLVVDDEPMIVSLLSTILREKGWDVTEAGSGTDGIDQLDRGRFDVILTDLVMPGDSGIDLLRAAKEIHPDVEVILMTGYATADTAIEAMRNGAFHYIMKPLKGEEVVNLLEKAYSQGQLQRENRFLKSEIRAAYHVQSVVGDSEAVLRLIATLQGIADVDDPALLVGERGTGRGFFARFVHFNSRRSAELCVPVHCAGVPDSVLTAELFGNPGIPPPGDRTSAPQPGKMELANHGTLYLADFAEAGREVLERVDRFLADKTIVPGGGTEEVRLDVRLIASTAIPVEELARRGNVPPMLLKALEPLGESDRVGLASEVYHHGEVRERQALLRVLAYLPRPEGFCSLAIEACRTSVESVFEAMACENPFPAAHFPESSFNQMVLKAIFTGAPLGRVFDLRRRVTPDLVRMAQDYAAERKAAGRSVPADVDLILSAVPRSA